MNTTVFLLIIVFQYHTGEFRVAYGYDLHGTRAECEVDGRRRTEIAAAQVKQARFLCELVKDV